MTLYVVRHGLELRSCRRRRVPPTHQRAHASDLRSEGPVRVAGGDVRDGAHHPQGVPRARAAGRTHDHAGPAQGAQLNDEEVHRKVLGRN